MSDAICCPLSDEGEYVEFCHRTNPKARKQHECCECGGRIRPGEHYEKFIGKCEGQMFETKTCFICTEIRKHFSCPGNPGVLECLWEDIRENFLPQMKAGGPCLEGLSSAAKERMFAEWRRWKGLR